MAVGLPPRYPRFTSQIPLKHIDRLHQTHSVFSRCILTLGCLARSSKIFKNQEGVALLCKSITSHFLLDADTCARKRTQRIPSANSGTSFHDIDMQSIQNDLSDCQVRTIRPIISFFSLLSYGIVSYRIHKSEKSHTSEALMTNYSRWI